jgi:hypothetical protein
MVPYGEFRKGLLRHIGVEEKIVLPAIERLQGGRRAAVVDRLRLDHGAMVALMVPQPSPSIIATLRSILQVHNVLEEQEGGLYQLYADSDESGMGFKSARKQLDTHVGAGPRKIDFVAALGSTGKHPWTRDITYLCASQNLTGE